MPQASQGPMRAASAVARSGAVGDYPAPAANIGDVTGDGARYALVATILGSSIAFIDMTVVLGPRAFMAAGPLLAGTSIFLLARLPTRLDY